MSKNYDEVGIVRNLSKNKEIRIDSVSKTIGIPHGTYFGNGTNGKLDYLIHYCGYVRVADNWSNRPVKRKLKDDDDDADIRYKHKPKIDVNAIRRNLTHKR